MTNEIDLASAVATELVKQVPIKKVYEDGLSPAVQETGSALADFVKTMRLALAPLQFTAALQDRYVKFLNRSVRGIPEDHRMIPAPQILGPVLEAIKYEPDDTLITSMYNELLAKAFDQRTAEEAHPAFAPLIKQLSLDEAIILKIIYEKYLLDDHYKFQFTDDYDQTTRLFWNRKVEIDELPRGDLRNPNNLPVYLEHLDKLGLVAVLQFKNQEPLYDIVDGARVQTGTRSFARYQLTAFGLAFMTAVHPR